MASKGAAQGFSAKSRVKTRFPERSLLLLTPRELETADSSLPARWAGLLASERIVLIYVPEGAVVSGINCDVRVVAPTGVRSRLHP